MNLQTSKKLGIFGVSLIFFDAILSMCLSVCARLLLGQSIPTYGIIRIIGIIIILISLRNLADFYQSKTIYTNAKMGAILVIISSILTSLSGIFRPHIMTNTTPLISSMLLLLQYIILLVCFIGSAFFVNSALTELASRSGIKEFASAGKWLLIGAILTIIIFGTIIIGIAFLILITAFSALKETNATPPSPYATETIPSLNTQTKAYYTYCGTPVLPEATFCTQCGKQI